MNGIYPDYIGPDTAYRLASLYPDWITIGDYPVLPLGDGETFCVGIDNRYYLVQADIRLFTTGQDIRDFFTAPENRAFISETTLDFLVDPDCFIQEK